MYLVLFFVGEFFVLFNDLFDLLPVFLSACLFGFFNGNGFPRGFFLPLILLD
jgi:hypothetical protein